MQDINEKRAEMWISIPPSPPFQTLSFGQTKLLTHGNSLFQALTLWGLVKVNNCVTQWRWVPRMSSCSSSFGKVNP